MPKTILMICSYYLLAMSINPRPDFCIIFSPIKRTEITSRIPFINDPDFGVE